MASNRALKVDTPEQSRQMLIGVLDNQPGAARDIVVLNAGAALYAANVTDSIKSGIDRARAAIESGAAKAKLRQLVEMTKALAPETMSDILTRSSRSSARKSRPRKSACHSPRCGPTRKAGS